MFDILPMLCNTYTCNTHRKMSAANTVHVLHFYLLAKETTKPGYPGFFGHKKEAPYHGSFLVEFLVLKHHYLN